MREELGKRSAVLLDVMVFTQLSEHDVGKHPAIHTCKTRYRLKGIHVKTITR